MSSPDPFLTSHAESLPTLLEGVVLDPASSLVWQIQQLLTGLIVSVRLRPGQLISEKELADCLGASKTPVREALIRLENVGLVTVIPKSGTYVTPIRISAYLDACFTRLQLETGAVRRAAERHEDTARLAELDGLLAEQADAIAHEDYPRFFLLDQALHQGFFRMAGVTGVWSILDRSQSEVIRMRHLKRLQGIRRVDKVLADHRRIVAAIGAGDPDAAQAALVHHIGSLDREMEKLAQHPGLMAFIESQGAVGPRARAGAG